MIEGSLIHKVYRNSHHPRRFKAENIVLVRALPSLAPRKSNYDLVDRRRLLVGMCIARRILYPSWSKNYRCWWKIYYWGHAGHRRQPRRRGVLFGFS